MSENIFEKAIDVPCSYWTYTDVARGMFDAIWIVGRKQARGRPLVLLLRFMRKDGKNVGASIFWQDGWQQSFACQYLELIAHKEKTVSTPSVEDKNEFTGNGRINWIYRSNDKLRMTQSYEEGTINFKLEIPEKDFMTFFQALQEGFAALERYQREKETRELEAKKQPA